MSWATEEPGVRFLAKRYLSSPLRPNQFWAHLTANSLCTSSPDSKGAEGRSKHSPPSNGEVNLGRSHTLTSPHIFMSTLRLDRWSISGSARTPVVLRVSLFSSVPPGKCRYNTARRQQQTSFQMLYSNACCHTIRNLLSSRPPLKLEL
jgi:hypothetical protein